MCQNFVVAFLPHNSKNQLCLLMILYVIGFCCYNLSFTVCAFVGTVFTSKRRQGPPESSVRWKIVYTGVVLSVESDLALYLHSASENLGGLM